MLGHGRLLMCYIRLRRHIQWEMGYFSERKRKTRFFFALVLIFCAADLWLSAHPHLMFSPILSSLRRKLCPLRIYNSLQDCSSTPGCQTIQMRHHRSPFSGTLQATVFTVQSQRLTALGRLVWPVEGTASEQTNPNKKGADGHISMRKLVRAFKAKAEKCICGAHICLPLTLPPSSLVEIKQIHYSAHMSC